MCMLSFVEQHIPPRWVYLLAYLLNYLYHSNSIATYVCN